MICDWKPIPLKFHFIPPNNTKYREENFIRINNYNSVVRQREGGKNAI